MMNKVKFLSLIIGCLLISNGVLIFRLMSKNGGPKDTIINKLHFDKEQVSQYESYIQKHRKDINDHESRMNALRNQLFGQLQYDQDTAKVDSLSWTIAKQQYLAEKINYQHFLEIKKLCTPAQQKDFNELTKEIADLFGLKRRK